ncbi:hypothetical protein [Synechococcus sp. W60.2]|uniref:ABC transporter ATP-binding protein C-terminal domain-containing protein n=1 Tax=unclassified Synechococcus TaxID=2626047 RepID=UPI0039C10A7A
MGKGWRLLGVLLGVLGVVSLVGLSLAQGLAQGEVKVSVLHSLTGTMAISEVTVKNATLLATEGSYEEVRNQPEVVAVYLGGAHA